MAVARGQGCIPIPWGLDRDGQIPGLVGYAHLGLGTDNIILVCIECISVAVFEVWNTENISRSETRNIG